MKAQLNGGYNTKINRSTDQAYKDYKEVLTKKKKKDYKEVNKKTEKSTQEFSSLLKKKKSKSEKRKHKHLGSVQKI